VPVLPIQLEKEPAMSAARNLPPLEDPVQDITITYANSTLTLSPQGVIIAKGEQVNFMNSQSSQAAINITFNPNPPGPPAGPTMFTNITNLQPGATNSQTAPSTDGSVNYTVTAGGKTYGPYAIQAGVGPLYVQVTNEKGQGNCLPDPAVIPLGGNLRMAETDHHSYTVGWEGGSNPFNPPLSTVGSHQATASAGEYEYTVSEGPAEGGGGGKIIVTG
jgi:hypothetical protein